MKAEAIVKQLNIEEKISLLSETAPEIMRLGIRRYHHGNEALHGVVRPGRFTVFPQAIGMGASFHPELIRQAADAISDEARARHNENHGEMVGGDFDGLYNGLLTFWSPNLNTARDPRWGRTGETYGEDPYLAGVCGTAFVRGLQGSREDCLKTVATPKHFVGNNEEHNRFECNADIPEDQYHDYYLKPFEMAVKEGKCEAVMAAYNAVNKVPCHANRELLTDILRNRWGFNGYVVSDCGAVSHLLDRHKYVSTPAEAAAAALKAGVDLECGSCGTVLQVYKNYLLQAYNEGLVTEDELNTAVLRVLRAREKLGILGDENPAYADLREAVIGCEKHQALALSMAEESLVLLKNENVHGTPILPIKKGLKIAVVGNQSDVCQFGDYSGTPVHPPVTILDGLYEQYPEADIRYVPYERNRVGDTFAIVEAEYLYHMENGEQKPGLSGGYDSLAMAGTRSRIDSRVAFEWENMAPDPMIQRKEFKITWTGLLIPKQSGSYEFAVRANEKECACKGRYRLTVDGKPAHLGEFSLKGGRAYAISLDYTNTGSRPSVTLLWKISNAGRCGRFEREKNAAAQCDVVLACVGLGTEYEAEGRDKTDLNLPAEQMELLEAVGSVNSNLIVTLYNGSSLTIPWIKEHAKGLLECWYPGETGGRAIARVLCGKVNPSGRLPLTFYKDVKDLPSFQCYDISQGFTYWYARDVLYPFGYGLGYSEFEYSDFTLKEAKGALTASVCVKNKGSMAGFEAVQIYAAHTQSPRKLVAVEKVWLEAGAGQVVELSIPDSRLTVYEKESGGSGVKEGRYALYVAKNAEQMLLKQERIREGQRWKE